MSTTQTLKLNYPPEVEEYVAQQLAKGRFDSESALATAAIRALQDLDARHSELRERIRISLEQAARGEVAPLDIAELKADLIAEWEAGEKKFCNEQQRSIEQADHGEFEPLDTEGTLADARLHSARDIRAAFEDDRHE
ncbi:MAG: hypothetical protein DWQ34_19025 [Planctomycetota bacterium]|nr:MAG: hypothetical protein DWQ34_19025 [Planctomycetota bacterium]REK24328.1 MAG: hypothetical protein DWQ41_14995 [Planctomycetota bacterium]REK34643.1 MAG: hypothetical protein DWQ45_13170 [Planctomycetota bacterium]